MKLTLKIIGLGYGIHDTGDGIEESLYMASGHVRRWQINDTVSLRETSDARGHRVSFGPP